MEKWAHQTPHKFTSPYTLCSFVGVWEDCNFILFDVITGGSMPLYWASIWSIKHLDNYLTVMLVQHCPPLRVEAAQSLAHLDNSGP